MTPFSIRGYGPPGTGKTYRGTAWIQQQVQAGADPQGVAFVSFTNAACDEARRRVCTALDLFDYELGYCATLHALCKRALRIGEDGREWLAEGKLLREFADQSDYSLMASRRASSEDMDEVISSGGQDAILRTIWDFGRSRLIFDAAAAWSAFEAYDPETLNRVDYGRYLSFVADYEEWKKTYYGFDRIYDYTDLLRLAWEQKVSLPVSIAVIDEAQDMTPLLWAVSDVLFANAEERACLGDDDQAIYGYQGANPELFNGRSAARVVQLHQSRRLPRAVFELAQRVIRQNRNRVEKDFAPVSADIVAQREGRAAESIEVEGEARRVNGVHELDLTNSETWMLLVRNWAHAAHIEAELEDAGVPYRIQGGSRYSPWSDRGPLRAVRTFYSLGEGEQVRISEMAPLLDKTRAETKEKPGAWKYGQKARISELIEADGSTRVSLADLPNLGLTAWGFDCFVRRTLDLFAGGISDRDLKAYRRAQECRTTHLDPDAVSISSIHQVKGQEADNVAALMSCTRSPYRNLERADRREEEIRLSYVAITRAKRRFFAIDQQFDFPFDVFGL